MLSKLDEEHFCLWPSIKLLTNNLLNSWNEVMVFGGNLPNYTLVRPFNVVGNSLHMIFIRYTLKMHGCLECGNVTTRITLSIIWVQGRYFELGRRVVTRDGHNEGGISHLDEVIHMICSPHGIFHFFHDSFHLIHLPHQMWYPMSNGTFGLISFNIVLSPFIFWILFPFFTRSMLTQSINFSS